MTVHIRGGRAMWNNPPRAEIHDGNYGDPLFKLDVAELREHKSRPGGEFVIQVRHETGTDEEHDAAFIAIFEGAGLQFTGLAGPHVDFTGVLLRVQHYPVDYEIGVGASTKGMRSFRDEAMYMCEEDRCKDGHLIMPYQPPIQKFQPRLVDIRMNYSPPKKGKN